MLPSDHEEVAVQIEAEPESRKGENDPGKEIELKRDSRVIFCPPMPQKYLDRQEQRYEIQAGTDGLLTTWISSREI